MKKKIIIFMPSIEGGGVEKNLFLVSNYLSEKVKDLNLITISKKYKKKFNKSVKFITLSSNFWDKLSRRSKYLLALILLLKEILKDRNTIVFSFQANVYCIILCKLFFIKVISRSNSAPVGWSKNPFKRFIFKIILNLADKIMVNSYEFKKELKKEFNVNSICIYNPLNKDEIIIKSKKKLNKIFKTNNLKILNIGRFTDQKDQLTLLKALNLLKNKIKFEAVIIGRGVLKEKLSNYIKDNNLQDFVKLKNFVDNPFPLIKQTDLFILSSKYEGLPNVLLEALVLKKFIISSNCSTGPKEILLNGKGGYLYNVENYKQLTKKIIFYNENKKKSLKLLDHSYKCLKRFDFKDNLFKYYKLVKSL
jgi:glycosyltransferase involved in cell wall biosynthesis